MALKVVASSLSTRGWFGSTDSAWRRALSASTMSPLARYSAAADTDRSSTGSEMRCAGFSARAASASAEASGFRPRLH